MFDAVTLSHQISGFAVTAVYTCTGYNKISNTCQTAKCLSRTSHLYTKS